VTALHTARYLFLVALLLFAAVLVLVGRKRT
jgi:hypothetical protein